MYYCLNKFLLLLFPLQIFLPLSICLSIYLSCFLAFFREKTERDRERDTREDRDGEGNHNKNNNNILYIVHSTRRVSYQLIICFGNSTTIDREREEELRRERGREEEVFDRFVLQSITVEKYNVGKRRRRRTVGRMAYFSYTNGLYLL